MKDESDIISNQSDQTESFLTNNNNNNNTKNKSNTKMTDSNLPSSSCNSSTKLEPQNYSSISSTNTQLNETDTIVTSSPPFTTFKTQKRQFERIKNELSDVDNLDLSNNTSAGLSSASSSNSISNINESELADNDNITTNNNTNNDKHLIESESKRQRSDFELISPNLSKNTSSNTLMETDSDETQPSSLLNSKSSSSSTRELEMQQSGENINTHSDEDESNLSNSKQPNFNSLPKSTATKSSSIIANYDDDDDVVLSNPEESQTFSSQPSEHMESESAGSTPSSSSTIESPPVAVTATTSKNTKTSKVKIDLNECHDWDRIHDTVYFKERSFNFNDMINREFGYGGRFGHGNRNNFGLNVSSKPKSRNERTVSQMQLQSPRHMISKGMNSFNFVRRMQTTQNLNYHDGCVNALNFNRIGTLLASGSDDYQVCIWDWARSKVLLTFESGHKSNVFQTKFMPFTRDSQIVTCARDGQVRLALISSSGSHIGTKKLAKHSDSCHKLSIEYDSSNMFLSCGEDGVVYEIDLRQQTPAKILTVKNYSRNCKIPLYSVSNNPFDTYQFAVAGRDPYIRIYDKRMLVDDRSKILKLFAPNDLKTSQRASITSAVYNHNGTEIIGSYSDDDIYLFETAQESESDAKFRYRGHRNSETIKGVNFYGANSDFIVSGSDCGRVFFWEKTTQQIVQALKGDENGVVNVLEPHPHFPILATSGLDSDIKIWTPSCEIPNSLDNLADIIKDNQRSRDTSRHFSLSSFEFELLLLLMHQPNGRTLIRSNEEELLRSRMAERENNANGSSGTTATAGADSNINRLRTRRFLLNRIEADESEATTTSNDEEEEDEEHDDDDDEEEEEDEDDDDFLHYDDDEDNESSYNFHEHENEDENFYESDNSRLASFFTRSRYSRDRNTDSHTSDQSSNNNNNNNNSSSNNSNNPNRNT